MDTKDDKVTWDNFHGRPESRNGSGGRGPSQSDILAHKTRHYWILQRHWNGWRDEGFPSINVQQAFVTCNDIVTNLGPSRILSKRTFAFMDAIVHKVDPTPNNANATDKPCA